VARFKAAHETFSTIAAVIFALVALLHVLRLVYGWEITLAGWAVPLRPVLSETTFCGKSGHIHFHTPVQAQRSRISSTK
jgi:hypothetical protein